MSALTKILIVLQLVFAVAVSVLLVLMVSRQQDYRNAATDNLSKSIALTAQLTQAQAQHGADQAAVASAEKGRAQAMDELAAERSKEAQAASDAQARILTLQGDNEQQKIQIQSLTAANDTAMKSIAAKDEELKGLRPQVGKLTLDASELARRNNELENQLRSAQQAIQKLQEQLVAQGPGTGASMNNAGSQVQPMITASSGVQASSAINARISNVMSTSGRTLIEMPLGTRDGIQVNTPLFIYRSTGYLADAVVERVTADSAVAVVTKTKEGQQVQAGDMVSTIVK